MATHDTDVLDHNRRSRQYSTGEVFRHEEPKAHTPSERRSRAMSDRNSDDHTSSGGHTSKTLSSMMMVKKRFSRWRQSKLTSWSLGSRSGAQDCTMPKLANTYRLQSEESGKFSPSLVRQEIEESMTFYLGHQPSYIPAKASQVSRLLADDIKSRVKRLGFRRYKLVVMAHVGQADGQKLDISSRCMWDVENDSMVTHSYQNGDLFAVATVFGTYFE